jgi:putative ABC transport system ATP-binding protein
MPFSSEDLETDSAHHSPKSAIDHVLSLFKAESEDLFIVISYSLAIGILSLVVPIGVQTIVNTVAFGTVLQPLIILTLLVFAGTAISGVISVLQLWVVERLQRRIFVRVAIELAGRIPRFRAFVCREEFAPELINRFFEVALVQKGLSKIFLEGTTVVLQTVVGATVLSLYHPYFLVFVAFLIISVLFILFVLGRGAIATSIKESSAKHTVLIWLENMAQSPLMFRSGLGRKFGIDMADKVTYSYLKARSKHFRKLLKQGISFFVLQSVSTAMLLGIGGYLVMKEQLTLGQLVAAEIIMSSVLSSLTKMSVLLGSFYDLVASLSKLDSLIELPTEDFVGDELHPGNEPLSVIIRDLDLGFNKNRVFERLNMTIAAGERVAICGENGSGKSLLAHLLLKLDCQESGVIEYNGQNLNDLDPLSIRSSVQLIKGPEFFRGTIEDNLCLGSKTYDNGFIRQVLNSLGLQDDIEGLKNGLKTWLHEDGRPMSGGQAARLVLGRALLQKPRLLILDETLDKVDWEVLITYVFPTLKDPKLNATVIVMTHDISVAKVFNKAFILKDGKLSTV